MAKYINPNNETVHLALGRPTFRNVGVSPYRRPKPGDAHRVIAMPEDKAAFFVQQGMIVKLSDKAPEAGADVKPDFDYDVLLQRMALAPARNSKTETIDPAMQAAQVAAREAADAEFRAKEARELAEADERKAAEAELAARREADRIAAMGLKPDAANPNPEGTAARPDQVGDVGAQNATADATDNTNGDGVSQTVP